MAEVQAYSEKVMRANLSKLPDGEYTGEDFTDGLIVVARTSGGGGFGDPRERPRDAVRQDLAKGYIGPDSARDIYGYNV